MTTIRNAHEADLPALMDIKGEGSEALHRDRPRDAQNPTFRYLVLLSDREVRFAHRIVLWMACTQVLDLSHPPNYHLSI
jgi:hypothetical protein